VGAGSKLVNEAGTTMEEIVRGVQRVTDIMSEITAASQEQTAGIEQINQAIAQMDEVTQQNASLVEEAAAASSSMQEQAAGLAQVVSVFKLDGLQKTSLTIASAAERTAPGKRQNTRKPARTSPSRLSRPASPKPTPASAGAGDWEEF
jgi:methyl-accepting chemotaxis protein